MQDLVRYPIDWRRRRSASCIVFSANPFRFQNILAHFFMPAVRPGVTLTIDIAVLHTFAPAAPQVGLRVTASAAQARLASFHLMIIFARVQDLSSFLSIMGPHRHSFSRAFFIRPKTHLLVQVRNYCSAPVCFAEARARQCFSRQSYEKKDMPTPHSRQFICVVHVCV